MMISHDLLKKLRDNRCRLRLEYSGFLRAWTVRITATADQLAHEYQMEWAFSDPEIELARLDVIGERVEAMIRECVEAREQGPPALAESP